MVEETKPKTTKQCPYCKSEIPLGAKKCPQCQSDLRNWFRRHPILTVLGVFIMFIIVSSIISSGAKKEGYIQKVGEVSQQETQREGENQKAKEVSQQEIFRPKQVEYKVGDKVRIGTIIIAVNKVEESYGNQFFHPARGYKWINVNLTLENTGEKDQWITTLGQMFIRDNENNSYQVAVTDKVTENPTFNLDGTLLAKSKRSGWVGFEVKEESKGLKLEYKESMLGLSGEGKVIVDLGI
jgi:hypothetical protein